MTGCDNDPILAAQVGSDDHTKKHCSHGNRYDEPCEQCASDDEQEIAGEYIKDDRIPDDPKDAEEAEYERHLRRFDDDYCKPVMQIIEECLGPIDDDFDEEDDPDMGLDDKVW